MTRVSLLVTALVTLAACGSSSTHAAKSTKRTRPPQSSTSAPTTTHPVTTTTQVNAAVADRLTQLVLTTAINAAESIYRQSYDYTSVSPASLSPIVPNVQFGGLDEAGTRVVGVLAQDRNDVLLLARSAGGRWYCVTANSMDGISYGAGATRAAVDSNGECQQPAWPPPGHNQSPF